MNNYLDKRQYLKLTKMLKSINISFSIAIKIKFIPMYHTHIFAHFTCTVHKHKCYYASARTALQLEFGLSGLHGFGGDLGFVF